MAALGPDWVPGPDGVPYRRAARVILLDEADRVLLVRGHDVDRPSRTWWFTVGGGIDAGETARAAAVRELREETGIHVAQDELVGPVYTRSALFDFWALTVRQDEDFFVARVDSAHLPALSTDEWTAAEADVLDELGWWSLDDLAAVDLEVFPAGLPDLIRAVLPGWDGVTRDLGEAREA